MKTIATPVRPNVPMEINKIYYHVPSAQEGKLFIVHVSSLIGTKFSGTVLVDQATGNHVPRPCTEFAQANYKLYDGTVSYSND